MTWKDFKEKVEQQGIDDDDLYAWIGIAQYFIREAKERAKGLIE